MDAGIEEVGNTASKKDSKKADREDIKPNKLNSEEDCLDDNALFMQEKTSAETGKLEFILVKIEVYCLAIHPVNGRQW